MKIALLQVDWRGLGGHGAHLDGARVIDWTIGGAIEHGSFLMAMTAVALSCVVVLISISGVIAYIRVKHHARLAAIQQADETAREIAERVTNRYLLAELPAIIGSYHELGQTLDGEIADRVAATQHGDEE
ncbi:hypothetical protein GCM10023174_28650 [Chelativorans composti]|uniref:Uncharacterized protein n=1 Tax=Chelativorans composti TaxID=768533 RepID=A0ABW5DEG7_9HYPH